MTEFITVTDKARDRILSILEKNNKDILGVSVVSGGCSGFKYKFDFLEEDDVLLTDEIISLNDTKQLVLDTTSLVFFQGSELDLEEDIFKSELVFKNPNQTAQCGCGKSFNV